VALLRCAGLALILAISGLAGVNPVAAGQDGLVQLIISSVDCEDGVPAYPSIDCAPTSGAVISVVGVDGTDYGSCIFVPQVSPNGGAFSYCFVAVPLGARVVVTLDESTLPAGYAPLANPWVVTAPTEPPDGIPSPHVEFVNVPQGGSTRVSQDAPGTFSLSISGYNCEIDPTNIGIGNGGCEQNGGAVVTVALQGGEVIGSCTLELVPTPYGTLASICSVPGVPLNSTLVISVDEATLPAGYVAVNSPQVFEVGDIIPGGGDQSIISLYFVRQDGDGGDDGDGSPPIGNGEPTSRPAMIHAGTCDDLGPVDVVLADVLTPRGPAVGLASGIEAASGSTTVAYSLDVLIDEPHAIVVRAAAVNGAPVLVCGDVGGVDNDDGALVVGLSEVDDSGFVGIAYLAYNAVDGSRTDVSVFLAEGLAD
jgi:hypothetical protein